MLQSGGIVGILKLMSSYYETDMTLAVFDTHKYVKRLTAAGMPEAQAEVIADEQRSLIEEQLATRSDIKESEAATRRAIKELEAATKRDIKELQVTVQTLEANTKRDIKELEVTIKTLEANTKRDIEELKVELKRDMKEMEARLEHRLTLRLGAMIIAGAGIVTALIQLI